MNPDDIMEAPDLIEEPELFWHWRNLRWLTLCVHLIVWPWRFDAGRDDDVYGGTMWLAFGPLAVSIEYSIGNCSDTGPAGWFSLSEIEACERAERYQS